MIEKVKKEFESGKHQKLIVIHGMIGAGKTSTLRRMVNEPQLIGERYIPVYINAGDYISKAIEVFLLELYKMMKDALGISGYHINDPDYSFDNGITFNQMQSFILSIEKKLERGDCFILLIIDDFEKMQQKADPITMRNVLDFIKYIIDEKELFRLILAGKVDISKRVRAFEIKKLFLSIPLIELGIELSLSKIMQLIVEPVEGRLEYEEEALKEIIRITGRNLYNQQLLCFYLVEYLNEKKKNTCTLDDVRHAINKTLADKRDDFIHLWEQFPYESKIVFAALADESVIKKEGHFYFLKDSPLLDSIFDKKKFHEILEKLHSDQHLKKIKSNRFDDHPFRIPLYGEWVKRNHTLKETIVDNWDILLDHISLPGLSRIMEEIPVEVLPLQEDIINTTKEFGAKWSAIKSSLKRKTVDRKRVKNLVSMMCKTLSFELIEKPEEQKFVFTVNMKRLNFGGVENVLLFAIPKEELTEGDIRFIHDEILHADNPSNPSLILCFKEIENLQKLTKRQFLGVVLIEESDLMKCVLSPRPYQVFRDEVLIKQINPAVISPYKTEGPVQTTFYGRHDEIGRIRREEYRNFAVVGARKIGKTSLLMRLDSEFPKNSISLFLNLEFPIEQNHETFLAAVQDKLNEKYNTNIDFNNDLNIFSDTIKELSKSKGKVVFFIDEVDVLLTFDRQNDFELLKLFRVLAQEGYCQLIITGFRELYLAKMNIDSPLYNFFEFITLDQLGKYEALALVSEPIKKIGIKYVNKDDRELILDYTSCHPNLIQFFCKRLIEKIQEKQIIRERKKIAREDIDDLYTSSDYEKYIVDDFYLFFSKAIPPIERLIVLLSIKKLSSKKTFSTTEIMKLLNRKGITLSFGSIEEHMASLCLRYILKGEKGGEYRFALPIFVQMMKNRKDLRSLITEAKKDAKKPL